MFGALRLLLASMVIASHCGVNPGDVWLSVVAVVIFYMISGYAMTGLLQSRFPDGRNALAFFLERIVRLAPQYYFWLIASLLAIAAGLLSVKADGFLPYGLFAYLTVVPLGLQRYLGPVNTLVMAQATTLGIEVALYVFSPWILKSRLLSWLSGLALLILFYATAKNWIPANIYTYYTFPGPGMFYILGSFIYKKAWTAVAIFSAALLGIVSLNHGRHFEQEYLVGLALGLPAMVILSRFRGGAIDALLGNTSYGCYLCQMIIIFGMQKLAGSDHLNPVLIGVTVLGCWACGWISFQLVEKPTIAFRRRLRTSPSVTKTPPAGQHVGALP